ncbi:MAG: DivIVA domain-containing protein [Propionibacteriaceae bacterium]|nr:DivIVA domain-containing protein [Propionibacteriaceae bacterium]
MTMTLDEVRKTRFHMSRRNGYEVTDVDIFVDKVEEAIQVLTTENENLRRTANQAESTPGNDQEVENLRFQLTRLQDDRNGASTQIAQLTAELEQARAIAQTAATSGADEATVRELEMLRKQVSDVKGQLDQTKGQLDQSKTQLDQTKTQLDQTKTQLDQTKNQLADAQQNAVGQDQYMRLTGENHQLREQLEQMMAAEKMSGDTMPIAVTTSPEASSAVVRLVQLATEQADNLVTEATAEAAKRKQAVDEELNVMKEQADTYVARVKTEADAHAAQVKSEAQFSAEEMLRKATDSSAQMTAEAQDKAERMDRDARTNAERLVQEAQQRAATIDGEIAARRSEVFGALESERDMLFAKVEKLKTYEKSFRQTMTGYLTSQIERLDSSQFAPEEVPELLQTPGRTANEWNADTTSATPRLDALLEG